MNTRVITGLIIGAILAIVAGVLFPNILSASSVTIGVYVFVSCAVITFSTTSQPSMVTKQSAVVNEDSEATTLYVGNLPYKANEEAVKSFFESYVSVQSVRLMKDKRTGKRKGYGFIEIVTNDIDGAIAQLNDIEFQERTLKVRAAKEKVEG